MSTTVQMTTIPNCDLPHEVPVPAVYDSRSTYGWWAYMCESHHRTLGVGRLGTGYGQKLILAEPVPATTA